MLTPNDTISVPGKDSINVESRLDKWSFPGNLSNMRQNSL